MSLKLDKYRRLPLLGIENKWYNPQEKRNFPPIFIELSSQLSNCVTGRWSLCRVWWSSWPEEAEIRFWGCSSWGELRFKLLGRKELCQMVREREREVCIGVFTNPWILQKIGMYMYGAWSHKTYYFRYQKLPWRCWEFWSSLRREPFSKQSFT